MKRDALQRHFFFSSLIQGGEGELSLQTRALFMLGKTCTDVQVCIYILPHNTPTFSIAWFLWEEKVPFFYTQVMSSPHTKAWNCTWYIVLEVPNIKLLHISYLYSKKTEVQYLQQPPLCLHTFAHLLAWLKVPQLHFSAFIYFYFTFFNRISVYCSSDILFCLHMFYSSFSSLCNLLSALVFSITLYILTPPLPPVLLSETAHYEPSSSNASLKF